MSKQNFLGVFGHVAIDTICSVKQFPMQNTCEAVLDKTVEFGGTGGNLAVHAASLGVQTALASLVGGDFPIEYRQLLRNWNIDLTDLVTIEDGRTPSITIISDEAHNQTGYVDQGVMLLQDKMKLQLHTILSSKYVHVGTGRPKYALEVCKRARAEGKKVSFDPAQEIHYVYDPEIFSKVISQAHILFCNESEMTTALRFLALAKEEQLLDLVEMIVLTMGKRGSKIISKNNETLIIPPCKPEKVVDTTGAGDAYRAGFYAGLSRDLSLGECGAVASSAASFAVEHFGGQRNPANWNDVKARAFGKK